MSAKEEERAGKDGRRGNSEANCGLTGTRLGLAVDIRRKCGALIYPINWAGDARGVRKEGFSVSGDVPA